MPVTSLVIQVSAQRLIYRQGHRDTDSTADQGVAQPFGPGAPSNSPDQRAFDRELARVGAKNQILGRDSNEFAAVLFVVHLNNRNGIPRTQLRERSQPVAARPSRTVTRNNRKNSAGYPPASLPATRPVYLFI